MAILVKNFLTQGLRGKLGSLVFRTVRGKTIMSVKPRAPRRESELQRAHRRRFRRAAAFAKAAMLDPQKKAYYWERAHKLKLPNAYTAAITDYMRKSEVSKVDTSKYHGRAGDRLTITAGKKEFPLASVKVTMADAQGIPLATGTAVPRNLRKNEWTLRVPDALPGKVTQFVITTEDRAGNIVRATIDQHQARTPEQQSSLRG